jgi:hypothetical protein
MQSLLRELSRVCSTCVLMPLPNNHHNTTATIATGRPVHAQVAHAHARAAVCRMLLLLLQLPHCARLTAGWCWALQEQAPAGTWTRR